MILQLKFFSKTALILNAIGVPRTLLNNHDSHIILDFIGDAQVYHAELAEIE